MLSRFCCPAHFLRDAAATGIFFCFFFSAVRLAAQASTGRLDTIALSGEIALDGDGRYLSLVSSHWELLNTGQVGFSADVTGNQGGGNEGHAIFLSDAANPVLIRRGDLVPNGDGRFWETEQLRFSGDTFAFQAFLNNTSGGANNDQGLYTMANGQFQEIARKGSVAPDGHGRYFDCVGFSSNSIGQISFQSFISGTDTFSDSGIFVGDSQSITQIARAGQVVPSRNNWRFAGAFGGSSINDAGVITLRARCETDLGQDRDGIFQFRNGELSPIVIAGQTLPNGTGVFHYPGGPRQNQAGSVAFMSAYDNWDSGGMFLWQNGGLNGNGVLSEVALSGQLVPGNNGRYTSFYNPALNDQDDLVFFATLSNTVGGVTDNAGVFLRRGGEITTLARAGQQSPDGNGEFRGAFDGNIGSSGTMGLNGFGVAAFDLSLINTVSGNEEQGIFVGDGEELLLVAREGQTLWPGATIATTGFLRFNNTNDLNDFGQVGFWAPLTDGRNLIQRWTPDLHWRAASGGDWNTRTNWTLGLPPAKVHDVFIDPDFDLEVLGPNQDVQIRSLQIGGGQGTARLSLNGGHELAVADGVTILEDGELAGFGIVTGDVQSEGTIFADQLTVNGNLIFFTPNTLAVDLGGTGLGEFDQLTVLGDLTLAGQLEVNLVNGFSLAPNQRFEIIDIFGASTGTFELFDPGLGQWRPLNEGDSVGEFGGLSLYISYLGGDGNDVELRTVPEPSIATFGFWLLVTVAMFRRERRLLFKGI